MSDEDRAAEGRDPEHEGLISRFWKAPTPVAPSPASPWPPSSSDREAEKG